MIVLAFLGVIVLLALFVVAIYNGLVSKRIETDNAWAQIDVQLKRRHDLIPNLVETVKGYTTHEKSTLEDIVKARNSAIQVSGTGAAQQVPAEAQLSQAVGKLFALSEAYPELKASANFQSLMEELGSTENRIGFARQHYNDSVGVYRTALQSFPSNIIAGMYHFESKPFFEVDAAERAAVSAVPKIKF